MDIAAIHHVTLIVDDLDKACDFYTNVLGLEELPTFNLDFPAQFYRINQAQQLHVSEWPEGARSHRGHVCLQVRDFNEAFRTFKQLDIIDHTPWGRPRRLPDGAMQMFIRDPSGNLIEISYRGEVDADILADPLVEEGIYVSGRNDPRGSNRLAGATLYHDR